MRKYFFIVIVSIIISSCGETENTVINNIDELIEVKDSVAEVKNYKFNTIEDYGTIKNKQQLIAEFGKENLMDDTSWYAEGEVMKLSTRIINPENNHYVKYVWTDDNETTELIEAHYYLWTEYFDIMGNQTIKTTCGLYLGMSLTELRKWNNANFKFSGFGWDYAGQIFNDSTSNISKCPIKVELMIEPEKDNDFLHLLGDIELTADDENVKSTPIIIEKLTLYLESNK